MTSWMTYNAPKEGEYVFAKGKTSFWDAAKSSFKQQAEIDNFGKRNEKLRQAEFERYKKITAVMGNNIKPTANMVRESRDWQGRPNWLPSIPQVPNPFVLIENLFKTQSNEDFEFQVEQARAQNPKAFEGIETYQQLRDRLAGNIQGQRAILDETINNSDHPILARITGGAGAGFLDPVNLVASILTGGASKGAPVLKAMGQSAVSNVAAEAAQIPFRAVEQKQIEHVDYTINQGLMDLGSAAVFGALFEGGGRAVNKASSVVFENTIKPFVSPIWDKALRVNNLQKIMDVAKSEPLEARAKRIENIPEPDARAMAREVDLKIQDDLLTQDLDIEDQNLAKNLIALNEVNLHMGEPMQVFDMPIEAKPSKNLDEIFKNSQNVNDSYLSKFSPRNSSSGNFANVSEKNIPNMSVEHILDIEQSNGAFGENFNGIIRVAEYRGRKMYQGRFDPIELKTDPKTFQYKDGGDLNGVTDRLKNVTKWDETRSGKTIVWENVEGQRFVADGHQRRGLGERAKKAGDDNVALDGYLFREVDGWSAKAVRVIAAIKNIGENSGSVLDAAKVFREAPFEADGSLPLSGAVARDGLEISKLSDDAFGAIINGAIKEQDGAIVGRIAPDMKLLHLSMLKILKDGNYSNRAEKELAVRKLLNHHWVDENGSQGEMFDLGVLVPELFHEKNKIINAAVNALKKHSKSFEYLVAKSDLYENVGNHLAKDVNEFEAQTANAAASVLARLAEYPGPIKDAVEKAAQDLANGGKINNILDDIIGKVREVSENKSMGQILFETPAPDPKSVEAMAQIADSESRYDFIGEDVAPIEKDELTFDMFGDMKEQDKLIISGENDLQTISVCAPKNNGGV